jgi:hypothetical protein
MEEQRTELWRDSRPIGEPVLGNHVGAVECLLSETGLEVDLQSLDSRGESVMHMTSVHCNPAIFRLLVPCVQRAIHQVDSDGEQQDALQLAVQFGDAEVCRLLICEGKLDAISALTRDHSGQLVTKNKPWANEEVVLQLLRQHMEHDVRS